MLKFIVLVFVVFASLSCEEKRPLQTPAKKKFVLKSEQEKTAEKPKTITFDSKKWCQDAHLDLTKMMTALKETVAKGEKDAIKIPEEKKFTGQCTTLPESAIKCLVVSFAMDNTKKCNALNLSEKDRRIFEKLVSGK